MLWQEALWWLPTAAVAFVAALGFAAILAQPPGPRRAGWMAVLLFGSATALAATAWQQVASRGELAAESERLHQLWSRLDALGQSLPAGPGATPDQTFDTVTAALASLNAKIKDLQDQIEALQAKAQTRSIAPEAAANLAEYLRRFGGHRVVVSCVPNDVEAFGYANQLANVLRAAGWEAMGPEATTIFGEAAAMGIRLYARSGTQPPDAAKILLDAFARFNIPVESGIAPNDAIPDPATTELFVSPKP